MSDDALLTGALEGGRRIGLLGSMPLEQQVAHARVFVGLVAPQARMADLGSGAGLPGLVVAHDRPDVEVVLMERSQRRADHLRRCILSMGISDRVTVVEGAVETIAHQEPFRGRFSVVTARSFGPPALVAECAAGLLDLDGRLLVAEPPDDGGERWAPMVNTPLPLELVAVHREPAGSVAEIRMVGACPPSIPRRAGIPQRRPLF